MDKDAYIKQLEKENAEKGYCETSTEIIAGADQPSTILSLAMRYKENSVYRLVPCEDPGTASYRKTATIEPSAIKIVFMSVPVSMSLVPFAE